ncbi:unnamed protein product [Rotaria socialis]|uniref:catechol O-methyltransferase n=1 Tax=Rotaria socialis TaxID=392032 RepID=A0A821M6A1_9BILA|nr:unnamed protein product [Rotaria socialis]CAF3366173.1 unnamed protein product [Rotaria socialis]CAF3524192.1 unnamed protein product [Rotaria socialis]CAF3543143.1 unnamed protein product [Rotaria socialis]CAF3742165.1 unnamed protein product [Rotaria socialis]
MAIPDKTRKETVDDLNQKAARFSPGSSYYYGFLIPGTFLGYSSLRIANKTPDDVLIITIEINPQSAEIAHNIHQHAAVGNRIHIIVDSTDKAIPRLHDQFNVDAFDFIFIDHYKELYLSDFKLLEQEGLIKTGTTIVADNVICPGAPDYLAYVRNNPQYSSVLHETTLEYRNDVPDGVEISIRL